MSPFAVLFWKINSLTFYCEITRLKFFIVLDAYQKMCISYSAILFWNIKKLTWHKTWSNQWVCQIDYFVLFSMNASKGKWFVLQTNYDHWKDPLIIDDRRTPVRNQ